MFLNTQDGEVIGINAITVKFAAGISFAIPIDAAKDFLQGAVKAEKPTSQQRWYIGISMLTLTPHVMDQLRRDPRFASVTGGVFVAEVNYGSPAHRYVRLLDDGYSLFWSVGI